MNSPSEPMGGGSSKKAVYRAARAYSRVRIFSSGVEHTVLRTRIIGSEYDTTDLSD